MFIGNQDKRYSNHLYLKKKQYEKLARIFHFFSKQFDDILIANFVFCGEGKRVAGSTCY